MVAEGRRVFIRWYRKKQAKNVIDAESRRCDANVGK